MQSPSVPKDWRVCGWEGDEYRPYPICGIEWGSRDATVSALDLAQISRIMYSTECWANAPSEDNIEHHLTQAFGGEDVVRLVHCSHYTDFPRYAVFDFEPKSPFGKVSRVIAFKGTSTSTDLLVDISFWSVVKVLQLAQAVIPVIDLFPADQVQWLLATFRLYGLRQIEDKFWNDLETLIGTHVGDVNNVVVTGHSLGGGIAQVVAARLGLRALTWSAPGVGYSAKRFGIARDSSILRGLRHQVAGIDTSVMPSSNVASHVGIQSTFRNSINVVPQNDVVPRADVQMAMEQRVECRTSGYYGSTGDCHGITKTACEIWRVCGDHRGMAVDCSQDMLPPEGVSLRTMLGGYFKLDDGFQI